MTLKLGMQHWGLKLYKVYINNDPGLTMTYFTARSNLVAYAFEWGNLLQLSLDGQSDRRFMFLNNYLRNRPATKANFIKSLYGKGKRKFI